MDIITPLGNIDNHARRFAPAVVVLSHAGGSPRFYAHWAETLPYHQLWGIVYPGRDSRFHTPHPASLPALARECALHLDALLPIRPALLIGHSMGAWVAWETARYLEQMTPERSIITVVSGQNPPDCLPGTTLHKEDDSALIADMNRQNPSHRDFWQIPELHELFLPMIREDYRLLETYCPQMGTVADLTVVYGAEDQEINRSALHRWSYTSHGNFRIRCLPGGHFYMAPPDTSLPHYLGELLPC